MTPPAMERKIARVAELIETVHELLVGCNAVLEAQTLEYIDKKRFPNGRKMSWLDRIQGRRLVTQAQKLRQQTADSMVKLKAALPNLELSLLVQAETFFCAKIYRDARDIEETLKQVSLSDDIVNKVYEIIDNSKRIAKNI